MKLLVFLLVAAILAAIFTLKAAPGLSAEAARERLKKGALLIDVRTVQEFATNHLAKAVNIPLDELKEKLPQRVPDKSTVLLLHCRSGRRSGIAEGELRNLGYTNSFNIGSFEQAEKIVNGKTP
jgi:phage shock protein E